MTRNESFTPTYQSSIFDSSWFGVPSFFTDTLMRPQNSKGIPASFWKFTFVIMRDCFSPRKRVRCSFTSINSTRPLSGLKKSTGLVTPLFKSGRVPTRCPVCSTSRRASDTITVYRVNPPFGGTTKQQHRKTGWHSYLPYRT